MRAMIHSIWRWFRDMPWIGQGAVVLFGIMMFTAVVTAAVPDGGGGASRHREPQPPQAMTDLTQEMYNRFLRQARSDIASGDPDVQCDPDFQQLVIDQLSSFTGAQKVIVQHAMTDACIEEGQYPDYVNYSPYHAKAP